MRKAKTFPRPQLFFFAIIVGIMLAPVHAFAATLVASPKSFSYGSWPVKSGPYKYLTLTNSGSSTVTITQVAVSGQYKIYDVTTPLSLTAGKSFTFMVKFVPLSAGSQPGSLKIVSNAATITVPLSGTGLAAGTLSISPSTFSFGNVNVGSTASKTATLKASNSSIYIPDATTTNPEFTLSGFKFPIILSSGQSVSIQVNFSPKSSGSTSAQVSLRTNAASSPSVVQASGSGVAAKQHSVSLAWSRSTSTVTGYNIYRGTASGGPYSKLNGSVNVSPSFVDSTVQSGKTYYYTTTAVASSGTESVKSNEVRAVIPTP